MYLFLEKRYKDFEFIMIFDFYATYLRDKVRKFLIHNDN